MASGLKVIAPATIAHHGIGLHTLGIATDLISDEIIGRQSATPGVHITQITGAGKQTISPDPAVNTAGVALTHFFRYTGMRNAGIEIEIHKKISGGIGLGSSDASACAALILANALFGSPLRQQELLALAIIGESRAQHIFHAEQVAACMMGGIVLVRDLQALDILRLANPSGLCLTIVQPEVRTAPRIPPGRTAAIALRTSTAQSAHLGALVLGLERHDLGLVSRALPDHLFSSEVKGNIPGFASIREAAYNTGASVIGITDAGPAFFTISNNTLIAENVGEAIINTLAGERIEAKYQVSKINTKGAQLQ